jgi:UDP-4-amino-4,6-dideoxy-N-acetyl-beta-L-altrosamine N-acetyltransferase
MFDRITPIIAVRPLVVQDADNVLAWRNHEDVRQFMYTSHVISPEEHQRWMERVIAEDRYHGRIVEIDQRPIGVVTFKRSADPAVAEWGFYLVPGSLPGDGNFFGQAALEHAFSSLALRKICGEALGYNVRSQNFHRRLGFAEEGRRRAQFKVMDECHDVILFGLSADEFASRQ